jgi:hypothetical protein
MRRKEFLVVGLVLLMLSLVLVIGTPEKSTAANTVVWGSVTAPTASGIYLCVAFGDVNHDGHLDLVAGNDGGGVQVWAGDGAGAWNPLTSPTNTGTYYGLALGDVNNDGNLDIIATGYDTGVHIWTGNGEGTFWTPFTPPGGADKLWGLAVGDVNHDGKLDIATGSRDASGIEVWTGDGAGGWSAASTGLPTTGDYYGLDFGDLDNDGDPDLVAASNGDGVRAWTGNGAGTWTSASTGLPTTGAYYGVAFGDFDNDGDPDIVATNYGNGVQAWTGNGDGAWTPASTGLPTTGNYWGVALSDINNDGKLDIAAGKDGGVQAWTGDGGGIWSEASTGLPTSGNYAGVALGDLNDDGMPDIAAAHNAGSGIGVWVDDGTPDPRGDWHVITPITTTGVYRGLDVGDFDHDGWLDVVAASDGDGIDLWTGDGGNAWDEIAYWTDPDLPTSGSYWGVAFGDLDHNGYLDVVAGSYADGGVEAWRFYDDGWHKDASELPNKGSYLAIALGDLNNDGNLDILAGGENLGVGAWTGNGAGAWGPASDGLPDTGIYWAVAFGDINHDGKLDIVAGSEGAGVQVWKGDGAGNWSATTSPTGSGTWRGIALGDVNDDGNLDIVAANYGNGVWAWAGDGGFGWTDLAPLADSGKYYSVALGDINNDGKLDVVAGSGSDFGLEVWTGDGGASWTSLSTNLPTSGDYPGVAFGEIDNDGFLDLVGAKDSSGSVHAWTGAEGAPPSGWDNFTPTDWITTTQMADVSIQVRDAGSGLDVDSAEYSFIGDTGVWSAWKSAGCTGSDGVTTPQTIEAPNVKFNQDSGPWPHDLNQVKFRISDMAGNTGYSGAYVVYIDTTPPTNPITFTSSHWPGGGWQDDNTVDVEWDGASDETSGLGRYSYVFNTFCDLPDTIVDNDATDRRVTSPELDDGEWYIGVRTRDMAGVWAPDAACDGPYRIDTGPPTNPMGFSASHDVGVWSADNTIDIEWWGAEDGGSGVFGYAYTWFQSPGVSPPESVDTTGTSATSPELDDGNNWYFHLKTRDAAGNWTPDAVHWGPFYVDTTPPRSWASSPETVKSLDFTVSWTGIDGDGFTPNSGISHYEVQYRDGADGTWQIWFGSATWLSAIFSGEVGHTYYFRTRATDNVGWDEEWSELPADGDTHTTILEDLEVTAIEVTQVIQNLANDVPLVEGKRTFVRVHVTSEYTDVPDVDARLYGHRDGASLPGSPLSPTRGRITIHPDGGDRGNLDDAFLFELPPDWRSGTVELYAVIDPDDEYPEDDETNNTHLETVTFYDMYGFCVMMVPVHLHPATYHVGDAGYTDIIRLLGVYFPVAEGGIEFHEGRTMHPFGHLFGREYNLPDDYGFVLADLWCYDFWTVNPCADTHFYGMVHPRSQTDTSTIGMGYRPGRQAAGLMLVTLGLLQPQPVGGWTMAHELGHNLGREHVHCTCAEDDDGQPVDHGYPYDPCEIGPDDPTAFYGFWPDGPSGPEIFAPTEAADLMSYGNPKWISDYTYRALMAYKTTHSQRRPTAMALDMPPAWAQADEYLFAVGTITPTDQTAELRAFYRISEPNPDFVARSLQQEQDDGIYSLVLEDASGTSLYTHTFTTSVSSGMGGTVRFEAFAEVFPYHPQTARIVLRQGETELASRSVSAHAPTVTVLSPNGGEIFTDTMPISWTGSDADGDDLLYTVQYSRDDGETWLSVAVDWAATSLTVNVEDLSTFPGSDQARIRVIATDGVNTGEDRSDAVFTLARKPPRAYIVAPKSGSQFELGSVIVLRGRGIDAEDGSLSETALTWTSDLSGTLGTGKELWVSDLTMGTHRITLTATDSDGSSGSDTVTIFVGVSPSRIYLPIIVKDYSQ